MAAMVIIIAISGEYEDRQERPLFVCPSVDAATVCLQAIDNWFGLQGIQNTPRGLHDYGVYDTQKARELGDAFQKQFKVPVLIDYTGIQFEPRFIEVFDGKAT